jgi:hypothetical protein
MQPELPHVDTFTQNSNTQQLQPCPVIAADALFEIGTAEISAVLLLMSIFHR